MQNEANMSSTESAAERRPTDEKRQVTRLQPHVRCLHLDQLRLPPPILAAALFPDQGTLLLCTGGGVLLGVAPMLAALLRSWDGPALQPTYKYQGRNIRYYAITIVALGMAVSAVAKPGSRQWVQVEAAGWL